MSSITSNIYTSYDTYSLLSVYERKCAVHIDSRSGATESDSNDAAFCCRQVMQNEVVDDPGINDPLGRFIESHKGYPLHVFERQTDFEMMNLNTAGGCAGSLLDLYIEVINAVHNQSSLDITV